MHHPIILPALMLALMAAFYVAARLATLRRHPATARIGRKSRSMPGDRLRALLD